MTNVEVAPDSDRLRSPPMQESSSRTVLLAGLVALAAAWTIYFAKALLLPIVVAFFLKLLLAPLMRGLGRLGVPRAIGSIVLVLLLVGTVVGATYALIEPASQWFDELPERVREARYRLGEIERPVAALAEMSEKVEDLATAGEGVAQRPKVDPPVVRLAEPTVAGSILAGLRDFLVNGFFALIVLYFMLATDRIAAQKLVVGSPKLANVMTAVQQRVSAYVTAVITINLTLGVVVGLMMAAFEMPNPAVWGLMAAALNFVPYVGLMVGVAMVALVSVTTYPSLTTAILPPASYLVASSLEGFVITPWILGRSLTLSPVAIFVWIMLWSFLWGIPGILLAVPMLVMLKIVCDHVPALSTVGVLVSGGPPITAHVK